MRHAGAILLFSILLIAGAASALSITNDEIFALTRSESVSWKTSVDLELTSLAVNSTALALDGVGYDYEPASGTPTVTITRWGVSRQDFLITRGASAAGTFRIHNPGFIIAGYLDNALLDTCAATERTCDLAVTSGTSNTITILWDPQGEISETPPATPGEAPPAESGGGGGGSNTPVETLPGTPFPNPIALFPRFTPMQWTVGAVGFALVLSSSVKTRPYLPRVLRAPFRREASLLLGSIILTVLYLTAGATASN